MVRPSAPTPKPPPSVPATTGTICPYLLADGGAWRSSTATRAHRCTAVTPPALLAAEKQRRLCLTVEHGSCATFLAARSVRSASTLAAGPRSDRPTARAIARTTPLVLDHGRLALGAPNVGLRLDRSTGQAALVVLMALAFAAILFARLTSGDGSAAAGVAGATGTPGPVATVVPSSGAPGSSADPTPGPSDAAPSAGPTDEPSDPDPTAVPADPTATPGASTYVVQSGDTLSGIAAEFGTTWQILAELNDIDDPARLRVGQELQLP
jgi:LysM repeat protein